MFVVCDAGGGTVVSAARRSVFSHANFVAGPHDI